MEYTNEKPLTRRDWTPVLLVLALLGIAGTIELASGADHDTCEYPVDEITAAYIRGYSEGVEDSAPKSAGGEE